MSACACCYHTRKDEQQSIMFLSLSDLLQGVKKDLPKGFTVWFCVFVCVGGEISLSNVRGHSILVSLHDTEKNSLSGPNPRTLKQVCVSEAEFELASADRWLCAVTLRDQLGRMCISRARLLKAEVI